MASRPPADPNSVFADASVLFAAAYSPRGFTRDLLLAGAREQLKLWVIAFVLEETHRNLSHKAPAALPAFALLRHALSANISRPSKALVLRVARLIELKDAPVVAGAIAARAQYLATYDRRYLLNRADVIRDTFGVVVATPDEILSELGLKGGECVGGSCRGRRVTSAPARTCPSA